MKEARQNVMSKVREIENQEIEPSNSHQVGLQYKFFFHVHRMRSGLFYEATSENSTELDEVDVLPQ